MEKTRNRVMLDTTEEVRRKLGYLKADHDATYSDIIHRALAIAYPELRDDINALLGGANETETNG